MISMTGTGLPQSSGPFRPHNTATKQLHVGDETGIQGQNIGQMLTAIFNSQGVWLSFYNFKCANINYNKTPNITKINNAGALIFVGQLKVQLGCRETGVWRLLSKRESLHPSPYSPTSLQRERHHLLLRCRKTPSLATLSAMATSFALVVFGVSIPIV
jgi:hypothetical protein